MQTASQQKSLTISKDYRGFITAQSRADLSEGERATFTFAINFRWPRRGASAGA